MDQLKEESVKSKLTVQHFFPFLSEYLQLVLTGEME